MSEELTFEKLKALEKAAFEKNTKAFLNSEGGVGPLPSQESLELPPPPPASDGEAPPPPVNDGEVPPPPPPPSDQVPPPPPSNPFSKQ